MSELKPCPFCGGDVRIIPEGDFHEITCDECQLSMWGYTYEELARAWNRRV